MNRIRACTMIAVAIVGTGVAACGPAKGEAREVSVAMRDTLAARDARLTAAMARHDSVGARPEIARWVLPDNLYEISGTALTADGRLLAHNDQTAVISEIDYRRGQIIKQFTVGKEALKGDFEGIAVANDEIYLLESNGKLYEFSEGANGTHVGFKVHDTKLGNECEFEGVAFDRTINSLVLACKAVKTHDSADSLVLYRWKLDKQDDKQNGERLTRFTVPIASALAANNWKGIHPSDITVNALNGNYVIVASHEHALVEVTPAGQLVFARPLPGEHAQPEAIAITKDSLLIISDESGHAMPKPGQRPAAIVSLYHW